jgi:hypothetical protein
MFATKALVSTRVITLKATVNLLLCCSMLLSIATVAQLKVSENTLLTVKSTLSTKEETNTFESSALGDGEIYLVGEEQSLDFAENTSLHTLHIKNADKLDIKTPLTIKGDLIVENGTLHLHHDLSLKGELILKNKAAIQGKSFINKFNYAPIALQENATSKTLNNTAAMLLQQTHRTIVLQQKSILAKHLQPVLQQFVNQPTKPPPQLG